MRTTRLPTIRALAIRCQYQWGESPQINKFEQVSSDCHQMSLAGGPISDIFWLGVGSDVRVRAEGSWVPCLMSRWGEDRARRVGNYTVKSNASWLMVTWGPPINRQTVTSEDITFPQLR